MKPKFKIEDRVVFAYDATFIGIVKGVELVDEDDVDESLTFGLDESGCEEVYEYYVEWDNGWADWHGQHALHVEDFLDKIKDRLKC